MPLDVQNGAFDATITFTEAVSNFEQADVSLTGTATATITAWHTTDDTIFTATITPTTSGTVIIDVPADVATDAANNNNTAATSQTATIQMAHLLSGRTQQVQDAIVAAAGVNAASDVTEAHLADITTLQLPLKNITALKSGDFDGLTALELLELNDNELNSLPEDVFDGLTALTKLYLSRNDLSSLPEDVFDGLTALETLFLRGNDLSSLPEDVFDGLTALTKLNLRSNNLSSLLEDVFDGLTALRSLYLYENNLSSLPEDVFDGLTALTLLELNTNPLTALPAGILDPLTALRRFDIGSSKLTALPPGIFKNLTKLSQLYLDENQFSALPDGIFENLTALTLVIINRNPVDPLPLIVSLEKVEEGQFKAIAPSGVPFELVLPLSITNGSIDSGVNSITIPSGGVESGVLTVTRTAGTTADVTVDLGTLPGRPLIPISSGYGLVKSDDLPLEVISGVQAAPALGIASLLDPATLKTLDPETLEAKLDTLLAESDGSLRYLQAIALLESVLAEMRPEETLLLANYPNPFNPETWIPYHLADTSDVQITIYNARGTVVRRLDIGHQLAGYYTSRSRAAHWDGRNDIGERITTGIYFYQLQADNVSLLRKMVILK